MNQQQTFCISRATNTNQDFNSSALVTKYIKITNHIKLFTIQINYCTIFILVACLISQFFSSYLKMLANLFTVKPQSIIHIITTLP